MLEMRPTVFVVKENYHIMVAVNCPCLMWVKVGDMCYYDESCGIMKSDVRVHRMIVPKNMLDKERKYVICVRKIIERKPYFTRTEDVSQFPFDFKPVEGDNIRTYHISDSHGMVEQPVRAAKSYGKIDFLILNGDITDYNEDTENFMNIYKITDSLTGGNIPVVFSRGNHDMRGICAEKFIEFTPNDEKNTYYTFRMGPLWGIVLDCGEDKCDESIEYGHTICCHNFRLRQSEFIKEVIINAQDEYLAEGVKYKVVICHNPFTRKMPQPFDIEKEIFGEWAEFLREDIKPDVMICGHTHKLEIDEVGGKNDFYGQACPVIIGSEPEFYDPAVSDVKSFKGCGIEFYDGKINAVFTNCVGEVIGEYVIKVG